MSAWYHPLPRWLHFEIASLIDDHSDYPLCGRGQKTKLAYCFPVKTNLYITFEGRQDAEVPTMKSITGSEISMSIPKDFCIA